MSARNGCTIGCIYNWRAWRLIELKKLDDSFPWVAADPERKTVFISLISINRKATTVGQNAIGFVDDAQLERLHQTLLRIPSDTQTVVITLHHPLFISRPPVPKFSFSDLFDLHRAWRRLYTSDWFMSIFLQNNVVQAGKLYDLLRETGDRLSNTDVIVAYGHRHKKSVGKLGKIMLVEAPNVGTVDQRDVGFFFVSRSNTGRTEVTWCGIQ
jgi:hypothetical protein